MDFIWRCQKRFGVGKIKKDDFDHDASREKKIIMKPPKFLLKSKMDGI